MASDHCVCPSPVLLPPQRRCLATTVRERATIHQHVMPGYTEVTLAALLARTCTHDTGGIMPLKGVVLAGGNGSRLLPLTLVTNKHLLPVYDRPMIFYPLQALREIGCREVLVVVGGRSVGDILELLHDGSDIGLSLTYRYQRGALGIAHAIGLARDFVGSDPAAVVLGDNLLHGSLRDFAERFV